MADNQTKIDAAAEKAFAEAAEKKIAETVSAKPVAAPVVAATPAPVAAEKAVAPVATPAAPAAKVVAPKVEAKPVPAAKVAVKKTVKKAKPAAAKKAVAAKPAPAKKIKAPAKKVAANTTKTNTNAGQPTALTNLKDKIMATAKKTTNTDFTAKAKEAVADIQTRAKAAYDKGSELTTEVVEFQKGNLEALVESGKILAAGVQDLGRTYVEEAKAAVETVQADVKKVAAIKNPTELFQLQGEIARRNFDAAVAAASKNSEAFLKLANEAFAPVSSRLSLAASKFSKAA